jgi:hypothetical protein
MISHYRRWVLGPSIVPFNTWWVVDPKNGRREPPHLYTIMINNPPCKMDDMSKSNTFSLWSYPIANHGHYLCINHPHTSTYLVTTKWHVYYLHSNHLHFLPTYLWYLVLTQFELRTAAHYQWRSIIIIIIYGFE